jgi:hypothetical protein
MGEVPSMRFVEMRMLLGVEEQIDETVVVGEAVSEALQDSGWVKVIDTAWTEMALEPQVGTPVSADWFTENDEATAPGRENIEARLAIHAAETHTWHQEPRYVIHHGDAHGRQISRVPEHLSLSEFRSNPDRHQFEVGTIEKHGWGYSVTLDGYYCDMEQRGTVWELATMREVRDELARLQP